MWPNLRQMIVTCVLGTFACVVGFFVIEFYSFVANPFGDCEFVGLSGSQAKTRLKQAWPPSIDSSDVQSVSTKWSGSIDSSSSWWKIALTPDAAAEWQQHYHSSQELWIKVSGSSLYECAEGVDREIDGPPFLRSQTGTTPGWWSPPSIKFHATEGMLWYKNHDSGVARATYSGFDEASNTLWVYQYIAQHDRIWQPGVIPEGRQFSVPSPPHSVKQETPLAAPLWNTDFAPFDVGPKSVEKH